MSQSIIANNRPCKVELVEGEEYYFCSCGRSGKQPFCDGSHQGTGLTPLAFLAEKSGEAWLCACKQSGRVPFCDGSHKLLAEGLIGQPAAKQK